MTEVWKDIQGYEGLYQASSFGRIKRLKSLVKHPLGGTRTVNERILKAGKNKYNQFTFCNKGVRSNLLIHRIVAETFIPNPDNKPCVNHIDGNTAKNYISNLEWVTYRENELHKIHTLDVKPTISNFNIEQTENVIRINGKNMYGKKLQDLLIRFANGEVISLEKLTEIERDRFYANVAELKNRFNVPIISKRRPGENSYKEYYLRDSGIEIKDVMIGGRNKEYFL